MSLHVVQHCRSDVALSDGAGCRCCFYRLPQDDAVQERDAAVKAATSALSTAKEVERAVAIADLVREKDLQRDEAVASVAKAHQLRSSELACMAQEDVVAHLHRVVDSAEARRAHDVAAIRCASVPVCGGKPTGGANDGDTVRGETATVEEG